MMSAMLEKIKKKFKKEYEECSVVIEIHINSADLKIQYNDKEE